MRRWGALLALLVLAVSCSTVRVEKAPAPPRTFFDAAVVEGFVVGKSTQNEVRQALGEPYPDPLKSEKRWTYLYTHQKQIVLSFEGGILTGKQWSEQYGIGVPND